ncbi:MAG: hypothetical protein IJQ11_09170 [Bacteroidales bacterium]|nr:hypothetical protein [Bacteroidales bacterium]MBR0177589.1 hypothetical protein [Bacteroidales bacterium]
MNKSLVTLTVLLAATLGAAAQNTEEMKKDTVKTAMQNIENEVVKGYKAIENGVVSGYNAIQDGVVEGFTRVSDAFIMKFFAKEGETVEQAKERMKAEDEKLRKENAEPQAEK